MSQRKVKREIAKARQRNASSRMADKWAMQRMAIDLGEKDAEIERLRYWLLKIGRDDIVNDAGKFAGLEDERRRDALGETAT